jgi:hypothetical protein
VEGELQWADSEYIHIRLVGNRKQQQEAKAGEIRDRLFPRQGGVLQLCSDFASDVIQPLHVAHNHFFVAKVSLERVILCEVS